MKIVYRSSSEDACRGQRLMELLERRDEERVWIEAQKKQQMEIKTGGDVNARR